MRRRTLFQELVTVGQEKTATYTGIPELIQPDYRYYRVKGAVVLLVTIELFQATSTGTNLPTLAIDTADDENGPWNEVWDSSLASPATGTTVLTLMAGLERNEKYRLLRLLRWRIKDFEPGGAAPTANIVCFRIGITER